MLETNDLCWSEIKTLENVLFLMCLLQRFDGSINRWSGMIDDTQRRKRKQGSDRYPGQQHLPQTTPNEHTLMNVSEREREREWKTKWRA